jgi:hypothetical protein
MISAMLKLCLALLGLATSMSAQGPSSVVGTWEGLFNGQPEKLQPDGSYPETRTKFRLRLQFFQGAKLTGTLTVLEPYGRISRIKKSRCDPDGCSFEVVNYGEEIETTSWRIWNENGELRGMRNFGPLRPFGLGAGARIFKIEAKRINSQ